MELDLLIGIRKYCSGQLQKQQAIIVLQLNQMFGVLEYYLLNLLLTADYLIRVRLFLATINNELQIFSFDNNSNQFV